MLEMNGGKDSLSGTVMMTEKSRQSDECDNKDNVEMAQMELERGKPETEALSSDNDNDDDYDGEDQGRLRRLTTRELVSLLALALAYACLICSATAVVGSSAVVVKSVGGSNSIAPFALGSFLLGSAGVSLVTTTLFHRYGRRVGFLVGTGLGLLGAALGAAAIVADSAALVIVSSFPLGAANGIGMYLRFAAVEVVPTHAKAFAITLVLSGGCIAAFVGPESVLATRDLFGDDLQYLALFLLLGIFNVAQALFVSIVRFPSKEEPTGKDSLTLPEKQTEVSCRSLLQTRKFLLAVAVSTLAWSIMIMPMSVVRVAMGEVGYSARQSLLVMELHFLSMYAPGFVTSKILDRYGPLWTSTIAVVVFAIAMPLNLLSQSSEDGEGRITWIMGLVCLGVGWNLGFSSGTVLLTDVYRATPSWKASVQAANDFFMFLITGIFTFSTGYIYHAGGGLLDGLRLVNYIVLGLTASMLVIVSDEFCRQRRINRRR